jgi:hypothetical protein
MRLFSAYLFFAFAASAVAQDHPRDKDIHDPDTLAWWHTTEALSNDSMEGRDTGTAAYMRAAEYVITRFKSAGLKPAGDDGTYLQKIPMHEVDVVPGGTSFTIEHKNGSQPLGFLQEITLGAAATLPAETEAPLTFRGYCGKDAMSDIDGKIVVCFGTKREGLPSGAERAANARAGHAAGIINVDDPYFSIEPPRWPAAYSRSVTLILSHAAATARPNAMPTMALSAEAFTKLIAGSGHDASAILKTGGAKQPLASFDIPARLRITLHVTQKDITSPNVLAILPGTDPTLSAMVGMAFGLAVAAAWERISVTDRE